MSQLSEGQKAKVVFCHMAKQQAHLLLLDEPTNALDMEMIDSLADAIKNFAGGVVLVSHDMRLISQVAEEIWIARRGARRGLSRGARRGPAPPRARRGHAPLDARRGRPPFDARRG